MTSKRSTRERAAAQVTIGLLDVPTMDVSSTDVAISLQRRINAALDKLYNGHAAGPLRLPPPRSYKVALLSMGAFLHANGCRIKYANTDAMTPSDVCECLEKCDAVLVSDTTPQLRQISGLISALRATHPDVFVVSGGHHSTLLPGDLLENGVADLVVTGPAEPFLEQAVDILRSRDFARLRTLPGVAYVDASGTVYRASPAVGSVHSDMLPLPAYDLLPGGLAQFHAYLMTSQGCGVGCPFCSTDAVVSSPRRLSPSRFGQELRYVSDAIGTAYNVLHIADDCPPLAPSYWREVSAVRSTRREPLHLMCELRLAQCTPHNLSLLRSGGVVQLNVGIESLASPVLARVRPEQTVTSVRNALNAIRDCFGASVLIKGYFMVGLPGESCHSVADTIGGVTSLMSDGLLDYPSVRMFKPLPGSAIHEQPEAFGITLTGTDWAHYERYSAPAIHRTEGLTEHQLYAVYLVLQTSVADCLERRTGMLYASSIQTRAMPYRAQLARLV